MTFVTGNSERLRIDTSGNVGIGATGVSAHLQVYGVGTTTSFYANGDATGATLLLQDALGGPGNGGQLLFGAAQGVFAGIKGLLENGTGPAGSLLFQTRTTSGNVIEQMRISSNGSVGIGTSAPQFKLDLTYGDVTGPAMVISGGRTAGGAPEILFKNSYWVSGNVGAASIVGADNGSAGGFIAFKTTTSGSGTSGVPTERMRIDSSGNVGIGTSSIAGSMQLLRSSDPQFIITDDGTSSFSFGTTTGYSSIGTDAAAITFKTGVSTGSLFSTGTERMRITSAGDVGIGTSTPGSNLTVARTGQVTVNFISTSSGSSEFVQQGAGSTTARHVLAAGGQTAYVNSFDIAQDFGGVAVVLNRANAAMVFSTNGAEQMRITAGGSVGIGTNNPTTKLQVNGNISCNSSVAAAATPSGDPDAAIMINLVENGAVGEARRLNIALLTGGGASAREVFFRGILSSLAYAGDSYHRWLTGGVEKMRLDGSGNLLVGTTNAADSAGVGHKILPSATQPTYAIVGSGSADTGPSAIALYSTGAAAYRFYVGYGGTIFATNTTITAISDSRLKENIQDIDVGLDKVMALKPRKFDWKEGKGKNKKGDRGWIAQEFEQVFPEMIDEWKDPAPEGEKPYKAVNADLIPVLVKAIQEQQTLINNLTTRLNALEGK